MVTYRLIISLWGYGYNGDTIRFPISFPNKVFICLVTPNSGGQGVPHSEQLTNAGFYLLIWYSKSCILFCVR